MRDAAAEWTFLFTYGNPCLQAMTGIDPTDTRPMRRAGENPLQRQLISERIAELKSRIPQGGLREALVRALIYVGAARAGVDERGMAALRRTRIAEDGKPRLTLSAFKAMVREQYFMLLIDQEAALAAIPALLPDDLDLRRKGLAALREILSSREEIAGEVARRLDRMAEIFGLEASAPPAKGLQTDKVLRLADRTKAS